MHYIREHENSGSKLKPRCWWSKKNVRGERGFLGELLANVHIKTSGHREGREEVEEASQGRGHEIRDLVSDSDFFRKKKGRKTVQTKKLNSSP